MLIFLIGYMGCGKSTIGRKLSSRLGWELVDTDSLIERQEGRSVGEIFEESGEEYFRALEQSVVAQMSSDGCNRIISTGGGLPLWGDNMARMSAIGISIYISRTAENIASRLSPYGREKRPKLRGLNDEELVAFMAKNIEEREPVYRTADLVIEAVPLSDSEILNVITNHISKQQ